MRYVNVKAIPRESLARALAFIGLFIIGFFLQRSPESNFLKIFTELLTPRISLILFYFSVLLLSGIGITAVWSSRKDNRPLFVVLEDFKNLVHVSKAIFVTSICGVIGNLGFQSGKLTFIFLQFWFADSADSQTSTAIVILFFVIIFLVFVMWFALAYIVKYTNFFSKDFIISSMPLNILKTEKFLISIEKLFILMHLLILALSLASIGDLIIKSF